GNTGSAAAMSEHLVSLGLPAEAAEDAKVLYFHDVAQPTVEEAFARGDGPPRVIAGKEDRLFPLEFQRRIARERLALAVDPLPGGHMLALSQPRALADLLVGSLVI